MRDDSVPVELEPSNLEAEVALIACILLDRTEAIMFRIAPMLKEDAFFDPRNRLVYRVCVALHEAAKPVNVLTIRDTLLKMKNRVVQDGYLGTIAEVHVNPAHATMYAGLINEAWQRRMIRDACLKAAREAAEGADPVEIRRDMEEFVNEANTKERKSEITLPGDGIAEALQIARDEGNNRSKNQPLKWHICPRFDAGGAVIRSTDFAVLAARPGVGKTTFVLQWAKVQAQVTGRPVVFLSLETPASDLWMKVACCHAGVPEPKNGRMLPIHDEALQKASRELDGVCNLMILRDPPSDLWDLRNLLSAINHKHDPVAVVVDYLGLIDVPYAKNEYEGVSKACRVMRTWARRNDTAMLMVHQLNRTSEHEKRPPAMRDLRGSGQIEQDASQIVLLAEERVHEDGHTRDVVAILAKSRRGGAPAVQPLLLSGNESRFTARKIVPKLEDPE